MTIQGVPSDLLQQFAAIVGEANALRDQADIAPRLVENRGLYHGVSPMVLKPGSTQEVSAILKLATETRTAIVPQTGNTGLVGGQVPSTAGTELIVSLERMNRIRDVDPVANVLVAEGGAILAEVQKAAEDVGRLFPLSLGSEGSCRIGGNLATNAGGTAVLAYGNMRQLCLGLEVVLPTGEIWDGLRRLKKDNTGYDLRDLFIGAEGTLGIITGAVLKLFPQPVGHQVAFAGLSSPEDALRLFEKASNLCGTALTGFELMPRIGVEFTTRHIDGVRDPLSEPYPWYALIDISTSDSAETAETMVQALLELGLETGLVRDAVIASSVAQQKALWHMRESMSDAQKPEGGSIKHDVSVPVSSIPAFMEAAEKGVLAAMPGARICAFGHLGDGNIHYNISQPVGADKQAFLERWREINGIVHGIVLSMNGSISAEHGIGQLKRDELARIRPAIEIDLMRRIKRAFDPANIMNPGKVISIDEG
ncbi:FAD-binding oxidoreductase [Pseudorhizobium pelagicum]|uniref:2-hydroxyacid dehydrogenase n=1 Tax=Pseudorhizobium pelagicum TaxID=1509405 RepID=A0A922P3X8_9HYPH|nr:FAD-binding oxidoreductase [Pseudorhizobium pelagicum]KEQ09235.1 2-hydroxyacid dehydrogenase [Pseudorhizobium pelagicum]KEQ10945.1 2-hydroxyacid dehydrogenase [Pseudorhizobium pelagicum]